MQKNKLLIGAFLFSLILYSCSPSNNGDDHSIEVISTDTVKATQILAARDATATPTPFQPAPKPETIYFADSVPQDWIQEYGNLTLNDDSTTADLVLEISGQAELSQIAQFERIYAVGVPFDTVADNISIVELRSLWSTGTTSIVGYDQILMAETTYKAFSQFWGLPKKSSVKLVEKQELISDLWAQSDAFAILPFEDIEPKIKILKVDGISPLDRPMDVENYGLTITYSLSASQEAAALLQPEIDQIKSIIPTTNRDESKMTVVMMTGTTALARVTLKKIDLNGFEYPVEMIKDWFLSADLRHVSNEVSFMEGCAYVDAYTMQFCSKPDQIKVLENIGVNVVESTGNHLNDYPGDYFAKTLKMYQERGWLSFGGGINHEAAIQPATTEVNGNKIAFIGCNPVGFETAWATETRAGSANCDYDWMNTKIAELKSQGFIVITTFQAEEIDRQMYDGFYRQKFKDAATAGADIVQGSQAHVPMGFEFVNNSLIHYGLGNFLFDQMEPHNIREFYDRHIIYNGKYINTELLTATLTDWSRPVPMTYQDRQVLLSEIFDASGMR
ncbi:MAG: hypothetical protein CVU42_06080 [Chloroflexi bacterium HGW-Chloroflexi-4]|jgi:poly-gamma-glutamate synthesis protein (capsule biosynthesis protein)|nr:MAG: hypothetical protein CVU42_06080 [Chloroflexi bacterium HGW-Chloroflexi-4]